MRVSPCFDGEACLGIDVFSGRSTQRLRGMDYYWWTVDQFGAYVEPRALVRWWEVVKRIARRNEFIFYPRMRRVSFIVVGEVFLSTYGLLPPKDATVIRGDTVPDERARELGLI